jgi:hypothetical protein
LWASKESKSSHCSPSVADRTVGSGTVSRSSSVASNTVTSDTLYSRRRTIASDTVTSHTIYSRRHTIGSDTVTSGTISRRRTIASNTVTSHTIYSRHISIYWWIDRAFCGQKTRHNALDWVKIAKKSSNPHNLKLSTIHIHGEELRIMQ